jgi:flagellar hook-length control protein FliK
MLATLSGDQGAADAPGATATAVGTKTGGKTATGAKTSTDDPKNKTAAGDAATTADSAAAGAAPDASLTLLTPVLPIVPAVAATPATGTAGASQATAFDAGGKTALLAPGPIAPGANDLVGAQLDPKKAQVSSEAIAQTHAGAAADVAATATATANATIAAKADATLSVKVAAASAQAAQAATPQATTQATPPVVEAAPTPIPEGAAAAAASSMASEAAATNVGPAPAGASDAAATAAKDKAPAPKVAIRIDGAKVEATAGPANPLTAKIADALQPISDGASKGSLNSDDARQAALDTKAEASAAPSGQTAADPAPTASSTPASLIHAAVVSARAGPQTVANLTAQIVRKLDGRSTQFDVQLDPIGLGKVDVRIAIGADGRMSAAMSFDSPQAAAELKARSAELQRAMEQAGFDVSGGMSFDVASDRGQGGQAQNQQADAGAVFRGRAFQAALDTSDPIPPPQLNLRSSAMAGVDIRI